MTERSARYRPELDGLRGFLVTVGVLYHAGVPAFHGGYLAIGLFFALSGYLITGIILRDLERGTFSLRTFYERRVRRILPALLVMLLLITPAAVLIMAPSDLRSFGASVVAATLCANNILLYQSTDYFAVATTLKPLMHTWTLGVEEQYYALAPLLMFFMWRLGKRRAVTAFIILSSAASFATCLAWQAANPTGAFFLIWARWWDLGAGAMVALADSRLERVRQTSRPWVSALGIALIVIPIFVGSHETRGLLWSAAASVGTCLLLAFGARTDPLIRLLSIRPLVGVGAISYSVYLYHQPLLALTRLASVNEPPTWVYAILIAAVYPIGWLSWRLIEEPFRDRKRMRFRNVLIAILIGATLTLSIGLTLYRTRGLAALSVALRQDSGFDADANGRYVDRVLAYRDVMLPPTGSHRLLVIGDSFARDFFNAGLDSGNFDGVALSYVPRLRCTKITRDPDNVRGVAARADHIVIAYGYDSEYLACASELARMLRTVSKAPITFIGTKNFGPNPRAASLTPIEQRRVLRVHPNAATVAANARAREALRAFGYVDLIGLLSDAEGRIPISTPQGQLISVDGGHLTPAGAAWLGTILFAQPQLADIPLRHRAAAP